MYKLYAVLYWDVSSDPYLKKNEQFDQEFASMFKSILIDVSRNKIEMFTFVFVTQHC